MIVSNQPATLRARFEAFAQTLEGFENVDDLLKAETIAGKKRADYLFQGRSIIIEQKSLEVDPIEKPQKFVDQLAKERRFLYWGTHSTEAIFRKMPDRDELQRQLVLKIGKVIEDNVRNADKQTRDTREIFKIPGAGGILVLLNEDATMLAPDIVTYALCNSFQKKNGSEYRYSNIDGVFLISEAHPMSEVGFDKVFPILPFLAPETTNQKMVSAFMDLMAVRWAQFNGATLILSRAAMQPAGTPGKA